MKLTIDYQHALQICNNGMLSFDMEWIQRYPYAFGSSSWLNRYSYLSPFWGRSDEITMSLLENDPEWSQARTKIFHHSYTRSAGMNARTAAILDKSQLDVEESGLFM